MSDLIPFSFESHSVRAFNIDGNPWFVGKDVAEILGYQDPLRALKQHCKGAAKYRPLQTAGGTQEVRIINEPDTYRLITGSHLPEAERFEKWLFEEVLPSIRKTGSYAFPDAQPTTDAAALAQQLAELLKGKVLVDYAALQGMATALHAVAKTALCVLEEQCGKPLIQDLIPLKPHAPTAPPSRRSAARSVAEDPWQAPIAAFLNGRDEVTPVDIFEFCLKEPRTHSSAVRVSGLLRSLGYACEVRRQGSRVLRVYRRVAHG